MIRAEKIADGRVPLPAKSGYISENWGTVLEKSRRGRVYPAVFRTRQGESGRRPISCVRFTLLISRYPAVSRFDQGIPCCDVYPFLYLVGRFIRKWTRSVFFCFFRSYGNENGPDSYSQIRLSVS